VLAPHQSGMLSRALTSPQRLHTQAGQTDDIQCHTHHARCPPWPQRAASSTQ
jgi:hypothetical protein